MKTRFGPTPIPLPSIQDSPSGIGRLSREIRKAIAALRDRKIVTTGTTGSGATSGGGVTDDFNIDLVQITVGYDAADGGRCNVFRTASTTRLYIRGGKITRDVTQAGSGSYDTYDVITYVDGDTLAGGSESNSGRDDIDGGYYPSGG